MLPTKLRHNWAIVACFLALVCFAGFHEDARGGNGRFKDGAFDIIVTLSPNLTDADVDTLQSRFTNASRLLYNATEGQARFGRVFMLKNFVGKRFSDIRISFSTTPREARTTGRLGRAGQRVYLYTRNNIYSSDVEDSRQTIVHEWAHYAFDLLDEYKDQNNVEGKWCIDPPSDGGTVTACLMDNYKAPSHQHVTEFCWSRIVDETDVGNHDPNHDTKQEAIHHESCWQTIMGTYRFFTLADAGPDPEVPGCFVSPDFIIPADPRVRVALVLDNSASMNGPGSEDSTTNGDTDDSDGEPTKFDFLKTFANLFLDLISTSQNKTELQIISFNSEATEIWPLQLLESSNLTAAQNSVNSLTASGFTNIGAGMIMARDSLLKTNTPEEDPGMKGPMVMVLVTDGFHNYPPETEETRPEAVLPSLVDAGIHIHPVSLGDATDEALMSDIADSSGAVFWRAENSVRFGSSMAELAANILEGSNMGSEQSGSISDSSPPTSSMNPAKSSRLLSSTVPVVTTPTPALEPIFVEADADQVFFDLVWSTGNSRLNLLLVTPDEELLHPDSLRAAPRDDIKIFEGDRYQLYAVTKPDSGEWNFMVVAETAPEPTTFVFQALGINPAVELNVHVEKQEREPAVLDSQSRFHQAAPLIHIEAVATDTLPLINIDLAAKVTAPDGSVRTIQLSDSGRVRLDGDRFANDGIYSADIFPAGFESGNGSYRVEVTATVDQNVARVVPGDDPGPDFGDRELTRVRSFRRHMSVHEVVTELPDDSPDDTDNDGIIDDLDRCDEDSDGDGTPNCEDLDSDNDDYADADETTADTDEDGIPNFLDPDSDGDGIPELDDPTPYKADTGFIYGVDEDHGRFVRIDPTATTPELLDLGRVVDAETGKKIKDMEALTWDPETRSLFMFSNSRKALFRISPDRLAGPPETGVIRAELVGKARSEVHAMSIHPVTGELYGVARKKYLARVDKATGSLTRIGKLGFKDVEGLAFTVAPDPVLYGVDNKTGKLIRIELTTASATSVHPENKIGFREVESLVFDREGTLFGFSDKPEDKLIKIDVATGIGRKVTVRGTHGFDIEGMAVIWGTRLLTGR
ncbi:MAG: VWA domain-containing protein [bacterium]